VKKASTPLKEKKPHGQHMNNKLKELQVKVIIQVPTFLSSSLVEKLQSKLDYIERLLQNFHINNLLTTKLWNHPITT